jgi:UPF0716 protein FxsA
MGLRWIGAILPIIALAFPALELVAIYQLWPLMGWWTLVWLLLAAMLGFWLIALERLTFMPRIMASIAGGGMPFGVLTRGGLRFLGAGLLIFPGPISDAIGLCLLLASLVVGARGSSQRQSGLGQRAANDDVIEGEYHRVD